MTRRDRLREISELWRPAPRPHEVSRARIVDELGRFTRETGFDAGFLVDLFVGMESRGFTEVDEMFGSYTPVAADVAVRKTWARREGFASAQTLLREPVVTTDAGWAACMFTIADSDGDGIAVHCGTNEDRGGVWIYDRTGRMDLWWQSVDHMLDDLITALGSESRFGYFDMSTETGVSEWI